MIETDNKEKIYKKKERLKIFVLLENNQTIPIYPDDPVK